MMSLKKLMGICLFIATFSSAAYCQTDSTNRFGKDILYVEAFGNSGIYSFNYERILHFKKSFQFSVRAGFGAFPLVFKSNSDAPGYYSDFLTSNMVIPVEGIFSFGKSKHRFEIGAGYTNIITWGTRLEDNPFGGVRTVAQTSYAAGTTLSFAYRYEKPEGGFFMRAGISASLIFNTVPNASTLWFDYPLPLPKICIGYKFKPKR